MKEETLVDNIALQTVNGCNSQGRSYVMQVKTNIMPVKTKCSNQVFKPLALRIAPTAHCTRDAQR